jgi:ribonuclease HI
LALHTRVNGDSITVFCDGASRGNPGAASFGVVAFQGNADVSLTAFKADESLAFFAAGKTLGTRTNNEAEYAGLIFALKKCEELGVANPTICSDSELVIKQLKGEYKVKHDKLKLLFAEAQEVVKRIKPKLVHVRREKNQIADFLANRALDEAAS